jgi:glycosyltransferase involved in cell wall biosynthesis
MSVLIPKPSLPTTVPLLSVRPDDEPPRAAGVDIILPCYNPPDGWELSLIRHYRILERQLAPVPLQLILVNDGSTQQFGPVQIARLESAIPDIVIVSYALNRGKGYAIREGVRRTRHRYQICSDLDFPFGTEAIIAVYQKLLAGADVVAGERGDAYLQVLPAKRKMITRLSRAMNRMVLQLKIGDAQAGLKGFNTRGRELLLDTRVPGFLYDSEFMYKASKDPGLLIQPLPIYCRPEIRFSSFSIRLLTRELRNYLRILQRDTKKTPWPTTTDY